MTVEGNYPQAVNKTKKLNRIPRYYLIPIMQSINDREWNDRIVPYKCGNIVIEPLYVIKPNGFKETEAYMQTSDGALRYATLTTYLSALRNGMIVEDEDEPNPNQDAIDRIGYYLKNMRYPKAVFERLPKCEKRRAKKYHRIWKRVIGELKTVDLSGVISVKKTDAVNNPTDDFDTDYYDNPTDDFDYPADDFDVPKRVRNRSRTDWNKMTVEKMKKTKHLQPRNQYSHHENKRTRRGYSTRVIMSARKSNDKFHKIVPDPEYERIAAAMEAEMAAEMEHRRSRNYSVWHDSDDDYFYSNYYNSESDYSSEDEEAIERETRAWLAEQYKYDDDW